MMDEMAKTLARRRAAAENKDVVQQVSPFRIFIVWQSALFFRSRSVSISI
jgi:hypothetical protein